MFIRNCWYVVAWDHEVGADTLLSRTVIGEPLVLFRTGDGRVVALEDRCCHRLAPLSAGRKEGDCVRCGYHGLKFAPDGACVEVPGLDRIPPKARVRSHPVVVRNRWIFVWMGDPAKADKAMLPDNFSCDHPDWRNVPGYMHYDTPYLLIADNLLDFSHLSYVHANTLGGSEEIALAKPLVEVVNAHGQRGVKVSRFIPDVPAPPYYTRFRSFDGNLNRWFIYDFLFPSTLLMNSGGRPVTDADDDDSRAVVNHSCQTLTPETETSTHYFFQQSHRASLKDESVRHNMYRTLLEAFNEDRTMITAQYHNLSSDALDTMLPLHFDAALVRFRKMLKEAVDAENQA